MAAPTSYRTVARPATYDVEVKRSRFRCDLLRVGDEAEARAVVEEIRRRFHDARHHCSAYRLGAGGEDPWVERGNDDGEPGGSAGAPVLEVLRGHELYDVVAVVTRWFGGVLLGTGGLARAYADATRGAVDRAGVLVRELRMEVQVRVGPAEAGRLEHELRGRGASVLSVDYSERVELRIATAPARLDSIEAVTAEVSAGTAVVQVVGERWVDGP